MAKQLKKWQGWMLFGGSMLIVFVLGLLCFSLLERRAEVASVFNNRRVPMTDSIVAQNEKFKEDFPREYETWAMTADTTFKRHVQRFARARHPQSIPRYCDYLGGLCLLAQLQHATWPSPCH